MVRVGHYASQYPSISGLDKAWSAQQNHRSMKRPTMRAAASVEKARWMSCRRS